MYKSGLAFIAGFLLLVLAACTSVSQTAVSPTASPTTIVPTATILPTETTTAVPATVAPPSATPFIDVPSTAVPTPNTIPSEEAVVSQPATPTPAPLSLGTAQILGRGRIMDADFTADGHIMAIAWASGLSLVDTTDAHEIWWQPLPVLPLAVDIQAEGTAVAMAMLDGTAMVLQTTDHTSQTYPISDKIVTWTDIAWSPDNSQLAVQFTGHSYGSFINRIYLATGEIAEIPATRHADTHPYLVWSPDGSLVTAADGGDDCMQLVDIVSGETRLTLRAGNSCYLSHALAWSPDGRLLALGNPANTIDLLDHATNTTVQSISGVVSPALAWTQTSQPLFFNADGSLLATLGSQDYQGFLPLTVWRTDTGEVVAQATNSGAANRVASAFVDGMLVSLYEDGVLTRWDFAAQVEEVVIDQLQVTSGWPTIWSGDGRFIASKNRLGELIVWNVAMGQMHMSLDKMLTAVTFSHDGQWLAGVDEEKGELQLYAMETGQLTRTWAGARSDGVGVAFAPDGQTLAYGAGDKVVLVEVETGMETAVLADYPPDQTITQIRWSPDGTALVAGTVLLTQQGDQNGVNILWEQMADGRWTQSFQAEHLYNYGYPDDPNILFNATGSLVAFESLPYETDAPYKIFVYDRQQQALILTLEQYRLAAWQDDDRLLTAESQGDMFFTQWSVRTGEKLVGMGRENYTSWHMSGTPFFSQIPSGGRKVEIVDWLSGEVVATGLTGRDLMQVIWSPDGRFIAAASGSDCTITVWPVVRNP